ncbi:MAG: hypothetical protein CMJ78_05485 [Planctomycetaceae bacterium]|nr:hypothetical protein [Planctomycetaceae bacterium]
MVDFESALFLQERLVYEISGRSDRYGGLLICEHPPMVTIGRDGSRSHLRCEQSEFTARMMDVRWLNRGGGCLVHGPGQLAAYPIIPLDRSDYGVVEFRDRLLLSVVDMCDEMHMHSDAVPDQGSVLCRCGQFAWTGISVKRWVSYHGLYLNVCPDMDAQRLVQTGDDDARITSVTANSLKPTSMNAVRERLVRHMTRQLGYHDYHVYTGHPLLKRTKKKVYDYA